MRRNSILASIFIVFSPCSAHAADPPNPSRPDKYHLFLMTYAVAGAIPGNTQSYAISSVNALSLGSFASEQDCNTGVSQYHDKNDYHLVQSPANASVHISLICVPEWN